MTTLRKREGTTTIMAAIVTAAAVETIVVKAAETSAPVAVNHQCCMWHVAAAPCGAATF